MHTETDANLVRRCAQGESAAFVELIRRHRTSLMSLIRRLVADRDEVEDLLQETLVQSWLNISSVRNPERVQAWLLQVARNRCRDYHKSAERRVHPTEQQELESYMNCYGRAMHAEVISDLHEAVCRLSPIEQEIIRLFYLEGMHLTEISTVTGAPVSTLKSRLFTARHHLRSYFMTIDEEESEK